MLVQEGAFDEAVKKVDGVAHTASPFHFNVTDPYTDLINPAVNGTLNLLKSAIKEPKIQRVVITSSFAGASFRAAEATKLILHEPSHRGAPPSSLHLHREGLEPVLPRPGGQVWQGRRAESYASLLHCLSSQT